MLATVVTVFTLISGEWIATNEFRVKGTYSMSVCEMIKDNYESTPEVQVRCTPIWKEA